MLILAVNICHHRCFSFQSMQLLRRLRSRDMVWKGEGLLFFPAAFALAAVCISNRQLAHVSSPDYSECIRALSLSRLPVEPDMLFFFLIDSLRIYGCPLGSHVRKKNNDKQHNLQQSSSITAHLFAGWSGATQVSLLVLDRGFAQGPWSHCYSVLPPI